MTPCGGAEPRLRKQLAGGCVQDLAASAMRKVITPRREDADPAVTEVADQERVGHVSPGSVERASGSDARDLSAIGAELVHHADADAEAFRSGARRGLGFSVS